MEFAKTKQFVVKSYLTNVKVPEKELQNHATQAFGIIMKALQYVGNYQGEVVIKEHRINRIKKGKVKNGKPSNSELIAIVPSDLPIR